MRSRSRRDRDMASRDDGQDVRHDDGVSATAERRSVWGAVAGVAVVVVAAASLVFEIPLSRVDLPSYVDRFSLYRLISAVGLAAMGGVLATLRPRNKLGWLFLGLARIARAVAVPGGLRARRRVGSVVAPGRLVGALARGVDLVPRVLAAPVARAAAVSRRPSCRRRSGSRSPRSPSVLPRSARSAGRSSHRRTRT